MNTSVLFPVSLVTICVILISRCNMAEGFKIGAFNIQVFGRSKANKDDVMSVLARIIRRYDIVLIQEIRNKDGEAIKKLLAEANKYSGKRHKYKMVISDRLGRTSSKEQYAFLYRSAYGVTVEDSYHYDDGDEATGNDVFEREPFVVLFNIPQTAVNHVAMIAIHTDPDDAVAETTALKDVIDDVQKKWGVNDVMVLGDLNADCNAFAKKYWKNVSLRRNSKYFWPIGDSVDTTTSATDCAYDRFVLTGRKLISAYVKGSAGVYRFDKAYKLDEKETKAVSDHYPIELELELNTGRARVSHGDIYMYEDENDATSAGCMDRFVSLFNCACATFISRFFNR